ncbi:MAG: lysylphosphatidylglycerol synthase transmembrane domain-containing protein [Pseudomonadota bacterium]
MSKPEDTTARRDLWMLGGLFGLMIAGLVAAAAATGWEETWAEIKRLTGLQIAVLLALSLINYFFRGIRWHLFARRLGLPTEVSQAMRHYFGGFAMSATPGRVGELVRMRWLRRETGWGFEKTAPLFIADRAADLAAMGLILALALGLTAGGIGGAIPVVALALGAAYVATHPKLLGTFADWGYRLTGRFARLFVRLRSAARSLSVFRGPSTVALAGLLGMIGWLAEGLAFHLLLVWMGADIGLWMAVAIFVFATLAGGLTGAPGGLGGAEAAMIALLTLEGVSLAVAIPATLIIRVTTLWFAIGLGLLIFPLAERQSQRQRHANP